MSKFRLAGVLGGMGPLATVDFLHKVVALTPASCDQEHIPLIVHQVPQIADRGEAILTGSDAPFGGMLEGLGRLCAAGASFAVIACNSAHHWYERLARAQPLEILHIADAVREELRQRRLAAQKLAILGTRGIHQSGIYRGRLGKSVALAPTSEAVQRLVDSSIRAVKSGDLDRGTRCAREATRRALDEGAETVLLACTELPIALREDPLLGVCVDSTAALARLCIAESHRNAELGVTAC